MMNKVRDAYAAMQPFRGRRARNMRYAYGDQWADMVSDGLTEGEILAADGKYPVAVNLIGRTIRYLVARMRKAVAGTYTGIDPATVSRNSLAELDARLFEEFVISGCAVQRICSQRRPAGTGVWVDNISPDRFFVGSFADTRGFDIDLIGMIEAVSLPELVNRFSSGSGRKADYLENLFRTHAGDAGMLTDSSISSFSDELAVAADRITVAEVWTYEPAEGRSRAAYRMAWRQRYLAPDGYVLADKIWPEGVTHPYAVKFYPLVDGNVHSYVEQLIERQRSINRMLTTFEATAACAAKGTLVFPQNQLVNGMDLDDVGSVWARPDGVLPVTGNGSVMPQQIITNAANTGIVPIIEMQLRLFDEASGIPDVLKGNALSGNLSAEARRAIIDNAATSTADLLDTFSTFLATRNQRLSGIVPR